MAIAHPPCHAGGVAGISRGVIARLRGREGRGLPEDQDEEDEGSGERFHFGALVINDLPHIGSKKMPKTSKMKRVFLLNGLPLRVPSRDGLGAFPGDDHLIKPEE
jgi:hypothetical protein